MLPDAAAQVRAQPGFGVRKPRLQGPWPGRTRSPYPQEHRSQMHFRFIGAIGRHAPPSPPRRPQPPQRGVHKVSRALATVLNIHAKDNLNGLFAKSCCLFPFRSWPYARRSTEPGQRQPRELPVHAPSRRPLQAQLRPEPLARPWKPQHGTRGASVTSPGPGGSPLVAMMSQGPSVRSESSRRLTWQAQDKGSLELGET